jgi:hypothetical protein
MIGINSFMKNFYPTYLYIKTHNKTGLRYFGKTTNDPFQYKGSGKHWLAHIKKHGNDISTEILGYYTDVNECTKAASEFSKNNQIVESTSWANLIDENGLDGGNTGRTNYTSMSTETKEKLSAAKQGQKPWNTGLLGVSPGNRLPRTDEQKLKISQSLTGRTRSPESIKKTADKLRGRPRPDVADRLRGVKKSPETIVKMKAAQQLKGPLSEETKAKIREARKQQEFSKETKEKLKGMVVVVNEQGMIKRVTKQEFYSSENTEWVFHNSNEGKRRKGVC